MNLSIYLIIYFLLILNDVQIIYEPIDKNSIVPKNKAPVKFNILRLKMIFTKIKNIFTKVKKYKKIPILESLTI